MGGLFWQQLDNCFPYLGWFVVREYSDEIFTRFQTTALGSGCRFEPRLKPPSRAVPPSLFVSPSALKYLRPGRAASELG